LSLERYAQNHNAKETIHCGKESDLNFQSKWCDILFLFEQGLVYGLRFGWGKIFLLFTACKNGFAFFGYSFITLAF